MNSSHTNTLYLVVTGAPLTREASTLVSEARRRGWQPAVIATRAAEAWLPRTELRDLEVPVLVEHREPSQDKRLPEPAAVLMAPATFNSINKLATGIADTYALSVMCEAIARKTPTVIVPFVSKRLAGHPAWLASLAVLRYAGVTLVDPQSGALNIDAPLESGTGDDVAREFRWTWALEQFDQDQEAQIG